MPRRLPYSISREEACSCPASGTSSPPCRERIPMKHYAKRVGMNIVVLALKAARKNPAKFDTCSKK